MSSTSYGVMLAVAMVGASGCVPDEAADPALAGDDGPTSGDRFGVSNGFDRTPRGLNPPVERGEIVEQHEAVSFPCLEPCEEDPPTLTDVLDEGRWRFQSSVGDDVWVTFARVSEDTGTALFEPLAGAAFACEGEGTFSVSPSGFGVGQLSLINPPGCGGNFIEVEGFTPNSISGWLSQVTPMHGMRVEE